MIRALFKSIFILLLCLLLPSTVQAVTTACAVSTQAATKITTHGAKANGTFTNPGSPLADIQGFAYGTNSSLSGGDTATTTELIGAASLGPFVGYLTGLTNGATYYVRAYCKNQSNGITGIGSIVSFTIAGVKGELSKPVNNLGLAGYWPFNEATSTIAGDFSGNGNTGDFSGASSPSWVSGKRGGALSFDNTDDKVTAPNSTSLDITGTLSLSFWVKPASVTGDRSFFAKSDGILSPQYFVGAAGDELEFCITGDFCADTTGANLVVGTWYHVVVTYSDAGNSVVFYVNGAVSPDDSGTAETNSISSNTDSLVIGEVYDGFPANAVLDDIRIYNRLLGSTEAVALYGNPAVRLGGSSAVLTRGSSLENGLVGLWTFDGGDTRWTSMTAGTASDRSGNNNTGTLTNMNATTARVPGKLGQAMSFDGATSYVNVGALAHNIGTGDFTWAAWVYGRGPLDTYESIMDVGNFSPNMTVNASAGQWGAYWGGDLPSGNTLSRNRWYYLVMQREGTTLRFYQDGVVTPTSHTVSTSMANNFFEIGRNGGGGHMCECNIDDVRFYNRALSVTEIQQLYRLGQSTIKY